MDPGRRAVVVLALAACGRVGFDATTTSDAAGDADLARDVHNCGRIGHDCRLGACTAGVCQPFSYATGELMPWAIAVDADRVYWTNDLAPGSIRACPLAGCDAAGPTTLVTAATSAIARLALAGNDVYFTEYDIGEVASCPLTGCGSTPSVLATGENQPMGLVVVGSTVYWSNNGGTEIRTLSLTGTTAATFTTTASSPRTLIEDGTRLYWVNAGGEVAACDLGTCANPVTFASGQASPYFQAVAGGELYWSNNSTPGGSIARCALAGCGGNPTTVAIADAPIGLAADATGIYWVTGIANGGVYHCPLSGCGSAPDVLATGQGGPFGIALDAAFIYWTDSSDGRVMALARP